MRADTWFTEVHDPGLRFSIKLKKEIYNAKSAFQEILIYESESFGKILILDGFLMCTEKDEHIYHEMIVHPAMATRPDIDRVLVIGGGDGGAVRELCRYPGIRHIDLVEIDPDVLQACQTYLPQIACSLDDPRVHIYYEDGVRYIRKHQNEYALIIVDSTDPFGPGEGLFTQEFYGACHHALDKDGILVNQHESVFYEEYIPAMRRAHRILRRLFPISEVFQAHIPTYPSGHWLFGFSSKRLHPLRDQQRESWEALGLRTQYYNSRLHRGAFFLPNNVLHELEAEATAFAED